MWANPQFPADLVTFTEETLKGKLHFLCSVPLRFLKKELLIFSEYFFLSCSVLPRWHHHYCRFFLFISVSPLLTECKNISLAGYFTLPVKDVFIRKTPRHRCLAGLQIYIYSICIFVVFLILSVVDVSWRLLKKLSP